MFALLPIKIKNHNATEQTVNSATVWFEDGKLFFGRDIRDRITNGADLFCIFIRNA